MNHNDTAILRFESVVGVLRGDPLEGKAYGVIRGGDVVTVQRVEHYTYANVCIVERDGVVAEVLDSYLEEIK